jgi:hypothetical protein
MIVGKPRQHHPTAEIDLTRRAVSQAPDLGVGADGDETASRDGHRLGDREGVVHRNDVAVVEDELWRRRLC